MARRHIPVVVTVLFSAVACGGGDLVLPNEGQAAKVTAVSGDHQTGTILEAAAESLVVRVLDKFGSPVAGVTVSWGRTAAGQCPRPAS